jgi:hypothetical protein
MIEVKARGNTRVQKFPVTGQSGELKMEGAARDYEVILYADDNPEEGFSGLRFAEFRLEPANGGGGTLEAVVPFLYGDGLSVKGEVEPVFRTVLGKNHRQRTVYALPV